MNREVAGLDRTKDFRARKMRHLRRDEEEGLEEKAVLKGNVKRIMKRRGVFF